jgi:hypothetical protein
MPTSAAPPAVEAISDAVAVGQPLHENPRRRHLVRGVVAPKFQVAKVNAAGLPVSVGAIGDAAVRATLDAFEAAQAEKPSQPPPNHLERIERVAAGT